MSGFAVVKDDECSNTHGAAVCPTCGQSVTSPITRRCIELREQARKLEESMQAFIEEMREARRQQQRERENPPLGKRVNQHWGEHRKRRPPWQRDPAFIKMTPRPRR